ncbi:MAG TPA: hypothetical protein PLZ67_08095, partial [Bacteroidales bacterium]|nr:hypothetical protein [Bacteroidales bacterium]
PVVMADENKTTSESLYLVHTFEGKQLVQDFIPEVLNGLCFLWGGEVKLETTDIVVNREAETEDEMYELRRVLYTCSERKINKTNL